MSVRSPDSTGPEPVDGIAAAHAAEVDSYTDSVMAIMINDTLTDMEKRDKIRSLIEWLT